MAARTWVVGVDGSEGSRTALAWATVQAVGRDVEIVAVCTWRAPILPSDAIGQPALLMDWGDFEAELARRIDEIVASERDATESTASGVVPTIVPRIVQGRPAPVLIEASRDAELLVVGSKGRGGLSGVVLGSVSRQCATHASLPIVVVPHETDCSPVRHIAVGFDGSRNARAAVMWALEFAEAERAPEIEVVRSVELAPWMDEVGVRERFPAEVDTAVAEFDAALAELDPQRRTRRTFKLQDVRQALAEAASSADLVVLGARGQRRFAATLLGSVSAWMLHGAAHPTVIVPDPQR